MKVQLSLALLFFGSCFLQDIAPNAVADLPIQHYKLRIHRLCNPEAGRFDKGPNVGRELAGCLRNNARAVDI